MSQTLHFQVDPKNPQINRGFLEVLRVIPASWGWFTMVLKTINHLGEIIHKDSVCTIEVSWDGKFRCTIKNLDPLYFYTPVPRGKISEYRFNSEKGNKSAAQLINTAIHFLGHDHEYSCEIFSISNQSTRVFNGRKLRSSSISAFYSLDSLVVTVIYSKEDECGVYNKYEDPTPILDCLRSLDAYGIHELTPSEVK